MTVCDEMTHVGDLGDGEVLVSFSFRKADVTMHVYLIASLVSSPAARPSTPHFNIRSHSMMLCSWYALARTRWINISCLPSPILTSRSPNLPLL